MTAELNTPQYTRRWFRHRTKSTFEKYLLPFAGQKLFYVEIGVFEARSMRWMLENVLTHPESRAVGIDPWLATRKLDAEYMNDVWMRAMHNVRPWTDMCMLDRELSSKVLSDGSFLPESIDILYIDGDHNKPGVIKDIDLGWPLVKPGGHVIFDDYENRIEKSNHVKQAIEEYFRPEYSGRFEPWYKYRYQIAFKKVS